jgi:hypothetical protein
MITQTQFIERQKTVFATNSDLAKAWGYSEQTISNWRCGVQQIPPHVSLLFEHFENNLLRSNAA